MEAQCNERRKGLSLSGRGGIVTPEATPEPDTARSEADEKLRQEEAKQAGGDGGDEFATSKSKFVLNFSSILRLIPISE